MKKYGSLYSNLRVYNSRDFPKFNSNEMIYPNESSLELKEENKEMDKEGGIREIEMIRKDEFSFMDVE